MLNLFNKKIANTFNFKKSEDKLIIPFFEKKGNVKGLIKHYPSSNQEWFNSVYVFNKLFTKMLPVTDLTVNRLFQNYFNLNPVFEEDKKFRRRRVKARRWSITRIFSSRAEIKHTNHKVFITVYTFNRKKKDILYNIKNMEKVLNKTSVNNFFKFKYFFENYMKINHIEICTAIIDSIINSKKEKELKKKTKKNKKKQKKIKFNLNTLILKKEIHENKFQEKIVKFFIKRENYLYQSYIINEYKFKTPFLLGLNQLFSEIFNKKVDINIVNLKYFYLNSDLLSYSIATKLKDRKNSLVKFLKKALSLVKLPMENIYLKSYDPRYVYNKTIDSENILENKDVVQQVFSKIFSEEIEDLSYFNNVSQNLERNIILTLKHRKIRGIRLEAAGRLTRRLIASRSVFKVRYKGGLKNVDSSYKNLSSVMLKGNVRSNIQYINVNSKTRNGAFGLKGWVSSY